MSSFKVLESSHGLFTDAVGEHLPQMHFWPAERGGHKVRQLVQQPFIFTQTPAPVDTAVYLDFRLGRLARPT